MQKLMRRTAQAERQVIRRSKKQGKMRKMALQRQDFKQRMAGTQEAHASLKDATRRRREDWEMGSLAPRRDTPLPDSSGAYWGSVSLSRNLADKIPEKQRDLACRWAGGRKTLCIKQGDRVAIMEGPDKGKISTIKYVQEEGAFVALEGEHLMQNYTVPEYMTKMRSEKPTYVQISEFRAPIQAVRLVHPLPDPVSGEIRDVVINELVARNYYKDKATGRETWSRVVPGLNIEIPWPKAFEEAEKQEMEGTFEDHACDTLRIDAEEKTFVPTLLRPPMPTEVIDELRNRYSKFRTRHTDEYVAKKEAEEAEKLARRKMITTMRTPVQELNAKIKAEKRARGQPELTEDMLAKIGEVMARNRNRTLAGAGIAQVERPPVTGDLTSGPRGTGPSPSP
ncbi:kow motif containing protein [Diaporthe amygdali]|uniref:kow motif containing protein n=1 Tax=Phomopsis amygdali TaxID=1214568 RepID=UPI0022FE12A4|nr:kow motif containing protein [Diaporthe amygdali]KAJ0124927.1 kow motif containing protein [Diaporthe amygdali]